MVAELGCPDVGQKLRGYDGPRNQFRYPGCRPNRRLGLIRQSLTMPAGVFRIDVPLNIDLDRYHYKLFIHIFPNKGEMLATAADLLVFPQVVDLFDPGKIFSQGPSACFLAADLPGFGFLLHSFRGFSGFQIVKREVGLSGKLFAGLAKLPEQGQTKLLLKESYSGLEFFIFAF